MPDNIRVAIQALADGGKRPVPETYRIKITVEGEDDSGASLTVDLECVKRSEIMAPEYPSAGITAVVRTLEYFYYGVESVE